MGTTSKAAKLSWQDPIVRASRIAAIRKAQKGNKKLSKLRSANNRKYWADPVHRKKRIIAMSKGYTDEIKKIMSDKQKAAWASKRQRERRIASMIAYKSKRAYRKQQSDVHRKLWDSAKGKVLRLAASLRTCKRSIKINEPPNKAEKLLHEILQKNFGPVFVLNFGSARKIIARKIPDILHISKPFIVELFGDNWHSFERTGRNRAAEVRHRVNHFKKFGFKTVVIWASELHKGFKRRSILRKIARTFNLSVKAHSYAI